MRRCSSAALALGAADLVGGEPQAVLDVPDHLRLQPLAMLAQQRLHPGRVLRRAQDGEDLARRCEIGGGLLDLGAQLAEARRRPPADVGDLAVDRRDAAEIRREGDAPQHDRPLDRLGIGHGGGVVARAGRAGRSPPARRGTGRRRARRAPSGHSPPGYRTAGPWAHGGRGPATAAGPPRRRTRPASAGSHRGPSRRRARPCRSPAPPRPRPRSRRR